MNENINSEVASENNSTSNTNQIFDLIQSIQSKLNNEKNIENSENTKLEDLENKKIENTIHTNYNQNTSNNTSFDFSSLLKNVDIASLLNTFSTINQNNNINSDTISNNNFNLGNIDSNFIIKLSNMFSSATRDNPKRNLLLSLKPFLRKTRQDKLNEYVTLLTIVDAIGIFNSKGSDK